MRGMQSRNIIVIGASAGGFGPIKEIVAGLPADLGASIFIVWHMSPDVLGVLPTVLSKLETISSRTCRRPRTHPGLAHLRSSAGSAFSSGWRIRAFDARTPGESLPPCN